MEDIGVPDYETDIRCVHATLVVKIKDFRSAAQSVYRECRNPSPFIESFYVTAYPNGADEATEGWLVVFPSVDVNSAQWIPRGGILSCLVSIIDIEGNSRMPSTIEISASGRDYRDAKYLERSFILDRADELLPEGVLTLRCDFYFTWSGLETGWDMFGCDTEKELGSTLSQPPSLSDPLNRFLSRIPQSVSSRDAAEGGESSDKFRIFDFTHQILSLPQFHESRKRFGVHGIPPASSKLGSVSEVESTDTPEHIWMFDTRPARFLLSLEDREDNVGVRLLEASPVIKQMTETPMKEKSEKRVDFMKVDSRTFTIVLYFLENKTIPPSTLDVLVDVYTFSHLYGMTGMQQKCSEEMVRTLEFPDDFEELKRLAAMYSDEYLSSLLDSRWKEFENSVLELPRSERDDRPDTDSYI